MYIASQDQCRNRMGRVAWPMCKMVICVQKPSNIPQNPVSIGEHIKKRRLEQGLLQRELAEILEVTTDTIRNWEHNRRHPQKHRIPKIIEFLGFLTNRCISPGITPITQLNQQRNNLR